MSSDPAETFRQEAGDLLAELERVLLDLEHAPTDRELIDGAFRALHTLKGSGAMFGFAAVAEFVHDFETAFDQVRKGGGGASPALIALALDAKDHVQHLIFGPETAPGQGEPIVSALRAALDLPEAASSPAATAASEPAHGAGRWRIRFKLPPDALAHGANPALLIEELLAIGPGTICAITADVPPLDLFDPELCYLGWEAEIEAADPRAAVDDVFLFMSDGMELVIEPIETGAAAVTAPVIELDPAPAAAAPERKAAASTLRVPAERLDALMDQVGELVIAQTRLSQMAARNRDPALVAMAEELERLTSGLRDTTTGIRMVQIGTLFSRFRRLTHDLSRELGKPIAFVTAGEETELDKTMIDQIADPLVHLIRNAIDHGLEDGALRNAAGKDPTGTVRLAAVHSGGEIAISLSDDGAGLNAARIKGKAVEAGLIAADADLPDDELYPLIFAPGFSTAREVTSLSGRGVGMDVVKRTIEGLRGRIDLASRPGEGTTITLRLPLTLAIVDGMLVRVGGALYSIPLAAVEECVELPADEAAQPRGRSFLGIRDRLVPYLRLSELFGGGISGERHQKVVIVGAAGSRIGLVVDQILGNHQIVIKQLSRFHAAARSFSGATILGDGSVALILDIGHLATLGRAPDERQAASFRRAA